MINPGSRRYNITAYTMILLAVVLWDTSLVAAPYFAYVGGIYQSLSDIIYFNFHFLCHQMPERSLFILGNKMPVCLRCAGIYFGFLIGTIAYPFIRGLETRDIPHKWILIIALLPVGIDGIIGAVLLKDKELSEQNPR